MLMLPRPAAGYVYLADYTLIFQFGVHSHCLPFFCNTLSLQPYYRSAKETLKGINVDES